MGVVQNLLDGVAGLQQPLGRVSEQQHCPPTPIRRLRRHLPHKGGKASLRQPDERDKSPSAPARSVNAIAPQGRVAREADRRGRIDGGHTPLAPTRRPCGPPTSPCGEVSRSRTSPGPATSSDISPQRRWAAKRTGGGERGAATRGSPHPSSIGLDDGRELIDGERSAAQLAVEEEGRRRADAEPLPTGLDVLDTIEQRLVAQAGLELFL